MATFARGYWTRKTHHTNTNLRNTLNRQTQTAPGKITWLIDPSDSITLRGIPAIGRGVAGAIHGTNPDQTTR